MPPSTKSRLTSAITSRSVPGSQGDPQSIGAEAHRCRPLRAVEERHRPARASSSRSGVRTPIQPDSSEIGPCRITLPRSTMATASQVRSTSSSRCEDRTTVRPSATSDRIISRISSMPAGSSPFIGSSRMSSCGSPSRQAATPSRWRMPMEYLDTLSSARSVIPTRSSDGSDARAGGRLSGGGQDLEVLSPGQMAMEPGFVDDGPHAGQCADPGVPAPSTQAGTWSRHRHGSVPAGRGSGSSCRHRWVRGSRRQHPRGTSSSTPSTATLSLNRLVKPWVSTAHWVSVSGGRAAISAVAVLI